MSDECTWKANGNAKDTGWRCSGGATVLDEEVAGLQLDVEWTEGVEEQVRELLERYTLKRGKFDGVHDTVEVPTSMCVRRRWRKA